MPDYHYRIQTEVLTTTKEYCPFEERLIPVLQYTRNVVIYARNETRAKMKLHKLYPTITGIPNLVGVL